MSTRPWILDGDLWALIEPLPPPWPEKSPGPRPVADRLCLQDIPYVLHNDIAWQLLPLELGFASGQTCWRRLQWWQQAGVFGPTAPHPARRAEPRRRTRLVSRVRGRLPHPREGADTGPSPVDRRKTGSKHHLICAGRGTPFKVVTTAADVNDVTQTLALVDGILPVEFKRLAVRWERRTELHDAFVSLACSLICWRRLKKARPGSCYELYSR
ncbi:transposase [Streptomyces afghaniensis]|uniref:transposase n=1 Tax=Streptomyces afghaniensis TaxID=66865 RepID=UPI00278852A7|nr:transposase [Streptomyces afghaniensis]MDQ1016596.1 hypothetical protein [Streptomyces afghaniensis]